MNKKFWSILVFMSCLLSASAFATTTHILRQGVAVDYELPVNDPQIFSNIFFWEVKATCVIKSEGQESLINVTMLRKSGAVNNIGLSTGSTLGIVVKSGDILNITAVSGAKVELVNKGPAMVRAHCSTN